MFNGFNVKMFNPSEDEISFDSFIRFGVFCFKGVFFDFKPLDHNASLKEKVIYYARTNFFRACLCTFTWAVSSMIIFSFVNAKDFVEAAANVPNVVTVLLIALKALATYLRKREIWDIFQDLRAMAALRVNENAKYKVKEYIDDYHRVIKIYAGTILFVFLPMIQPLFSFLVFGTMDLPVNYWYPFNPLVKENYLYAFSWMNFIAYTCLVFLVATDAILYALITVVSMEFDILSMDLMNMRFLSKHERQQKIKSLTARHNKLLELGDKLQEIYNLSFLFSFVISSLVLCFVAFQLSTSNDISDWTFYVPYLGMVGGQCLLLCFYGQKILDRSGAVADGAFNCGWESFGDISFNKQLILLIQRSHRTKRLTAMNFANISLATFTSIITTTGSYFTLLTNVYSGK